MISSLLLAATALAALCGVTSAQSNALNEPSAAYINDLAVLNLALTVETFDSTYWSCFLYPLNTTNALCSSTTNVTGYSITDFNNAGYNASVYNALVLLATEELGHKQLLAAAITAFGGVPVQPCQYNFSPYQSIQSWLNTGRAIETGGTSIYDGALAGLTNSSLIQVAASIAVVEARHAAFLDSILGVSPTYDSGFEPTLNASQAVATIAPFFANSSCLMSTVLPSIRPYGIALGSSNATFYTGNGTLAAAASVSYTAAARVNDMKTLQYALFLEELESNLYNQAGAKFNATSYANAGFNSTVPSYIAMFAANENTHVAALSAVITLYGGSPIQNCTYNFTNALSSVQNYLALAQAAESLGVSAYIGAANTLSDTALLQLAATVATIEARHSAILNTLVPPMNLSAAFPQVTDTPITPLSVLQTVLSLGLITSCPGFDINSPSAVAALAPVVANIALTQGSSAGAGSSSSGISGASSSSKFSSAAGNFSSSASSSTTIFGSSTGSSAGSTSAGFNSSTASGSSSSSVPLLFQSSSSSGNVTGYNAASSVQIASFCAFVTVASAILMAL